MNRAKPSLSSINALDEQYRLREIDNMLTGLGRRLASTSRAKQGLPPRLVDPVAIGALVQLCGPDASRSEIMPPKQVRHGSPTTVGVLRDDER